MLFGDWNKILTMTRWRSIWLGSEQKDDFKSGQLVSCNFIEPICLRSDLTGSFRLYKKDFLAKIMLSLLLRVDDTSFRWK